MCNRCNHFLSYKTFILFKREGLKKAREYIERQLSMKKRLQRLQVIFERQPCGFACNQPAVTKWLQSGYIRIGKERCGRAGPGARSICGMVMEGRRPSLPGLSGSFPVLKVTRVRRRGLFSLMNFFSGVIFVKNGQYGHFRHFSMTYSEKFN